MSYNFEQLCKFKIGETYWESSQYGNVNFEVVSAPVVENEQVRFMARVIGTDETFQILMTKGFEQYGPSIYDFPAYTVISGMQ